jgi:ubiquinone/menaquinone biosynthesis C-methylase UbiE
VSASSLSFFDSLAPDYDQSWTNSLVGRIQRNAVWREIDRLIKPGDRILDLGCGTGEDALHLLEAGATVDAIDGSAGMVEASQRRGVDARLLRIEQIAELSGAYDLVLSNFGALNCVHDVAALRQPLAELIRPGGFLAVCVMNRFCLWESAYYALRGLFQKAARRWSGQTETSSGLRVFYPFARRIEAGLAPEFRLIRDRGIGVTVPPSYVELPCSQMTRGLLRLLEACDARVAGSAIGRTIADHRLLVFAKSR